MLNGKFFFFVLKIKNPKKWEKNRCVKVARKFHGVAVGSDRIQIVENIRYFRELDIIGNVSESNRRIRHVSTTRNPIGLHRIIGADQIQCRI